MYGEVSSAYGSDLSGNMLMFERLSKPIRHLIASLSYANLLLKQKNPLGRKCE